jgi:hypothetical protein
VPVGRVERGGMHPGQHVAGPDLLQGRCPPAAGRPAGVPPCRGAGPRAQSAADSLNTGTARSFRTEHPEPRAIWTVNDSVTGHCSVRTLQIAHYSDGGIVRHFSTPRGKGRRCETLRMSGTPHGRRAVWPMVRPSAGPVVRQLRCGGFRC